MKASSEIYENGIIFFLVGPAGFVKNQLPSGPTPYHFLKILLAGG